MRKVMILEDESSIRSFIVINLRRAGYEVVEAETGEEALDKLQRESGHAGGPAGRDAAGHRRVRGVPPHPGHQPPHRHHHADGPVPGDG